MIKIPKTIRIGAVDFVVSVIRDLRDGDTGLNGHILYNEGKIQIEDDLTDTIKFATIWHEVVHGILEQAGVGDHNEREVVALGYGITAVLRDNPLLRVPPSVVSGADEAAHQCTCDGCMAGRETAVNGGGVE